jgi:hypothetical protein
VVKVLGVSSTVVPAPVVCFLEFTAAGFVLRVNHGSQAKSKVAVLKKLEFMLEVSEIRA